VWRSRRAPCSCRLRWVWLQNDLGEFFAMVDFVNPGLLKDYPTFRKVFEEPIVASRQSSSTPAEVAIGQARSAEVRVCDTRRHHAYAC
jgi:DNA repair and recombination protein RAD54B